MINSNFARAFFIFVHFTVVLVLSETRNDLYFSGHKYRRWKGKQFDLSYFLVEGVHLYLLTTFQRNNLFRLKTGTF